MVKPQTKLIDWNYIYQKIKILIYIIIYIYYSNISSVFSQDSQSILDRGDRTRLKFRTEFIGLSSADKHFAEKSPELPSLLFKLHLQLEDDITAYKDRFEVRPFDDKSVRVDESIRILDISPIKIISDPVKKKPIHVVPDAGVLVIEVLDKKLLANYRLSMSYRFKIGYQVCDPDICYLPDEVDVTLYRPSLDGNKINFDSAKLSTIKPISTVYSVKETVLNQLPGFSDFFDQIPFFEKFKNIKLTPLIIVFFMFLIGVSSSFTPCSLPILGITAFSLRDIKKNLWLISLLYLLGGSFGYLLLWSIVFQSSKLLNEIIQFNYLYLTLGVLFFFIAWASWGRFQISISLEWIWNFFKSKVHILFTSQSNFFGLGFIQSLELVCRPIILGFSGALVSGPCLSPILLGVMLYLAQSSRYFEGSLYILFFAVGLLTPHVLLTLFIDRWGTLKGSSKLSYLTQPIFGFIFIFTSAYFLFLSGYFNSFAEPVLIIGCASSVVLAFRPEPLFRSYSFRRQIRWVLFGCAILFAGGFSLSRWRLKDQATQITSSASEDFFRKNADIFHDYRLFHDRLRNVSGPLIFYFFSSSCVSCIEMKDQVFGDSEVKQALRSRNLIFLYINTDNQGVLNLYRSRYKERIFGVPTLLFLNKEKKVISHLTEVGFIDRKKFLQKLEKLFVE